MIKPFVIVADQRTGSSLLRLTLKENSEIKLPRGEPLDNKYVHLWKNDLINNIYDEGIRGCVLLRHQYETEYQKWFWDQIKLIENLKVIHLTRTNLLARFSSLLFMKNNGKPVYVDLNNFKKDVEKISKDRQMSYDFFKGNQVLHLDYLNDLCNNFEETLERIQIFLGCDNILKLSPTLLKNSVCFPDNVSNIDELKRSLIGTDLEVFLEFEDLKMRHIL